MIAIAERPPSSRRTRAPLRGDASDGPYYPMWYGISDDPQNRPKQRSARLAESDTMSFGVVEPLVGGKSPMDNDLDNSLRA